MAEDQETRLQSIPGRDVFISYASPDKAVADAVCTALEIAGVKCWIAPRDVVPGDFYAESIVQALDAAQIVVLMLSEHSVASPHVLREVERGSAKRHPVISLRLDRAPVPPGLEYFLNTSQWLDASEGKPHGAIPKLIEAVRHQLAAQSVRELTPASGAARLPAGSPTRPFVRPAGFRRLAWVAIASSIVIAAGLAYLAVSNSRLSRPSVNGRAGSVTGDAPAPAAPDRSIAVLPFLDMSEKKDQEFFADGMTEDLLDLLSRVAELRVIARTSSFAFKGKNVDIRTIAARLGVTNLLEGSVRKSANTLRVTAQLIRASDGSHIWSKTYDRRTGDIFKIQDSIASAVVGELKISLLPGAMPRASGTDNVGSYSLTMQARAMMEAANSRDDAGKAEEYLRHALQLDPESVQAWSALARLRFMQANIGWLPTGLSEDRAWQEARDAAHNAIKFDPKSASGHRALYDILFLHDWNWSAADEQRKLILEINPNDTDAAGDEVFKYWIAGNLQKAIPFQRAVLDRDPLWSDGWRQLAGFYRFTGHLDEARNAIQRALDINKEGPFFHSEAAQILLASGNSAAALAEIDKVSDRDTRLTYQALFYCRLGQKDKANAALAIVEKELASTDALSLAEIYACRGDRDLAFQWLDRAYGRHQVDLLFLKSDEDLLRLRDDRRWRALLNRMNIPI